MKPGMALNNGDTIGAAQPAKSAAATAEESTEGEEVLAIGIRQSDL